MDELTRKTYELRSDIIDEVYQSKPAMWAATSA